MKSNHYILFDLTPDSLDLATLKRSSPTSLFNLVPFLTVDLPEKTEKGYSASSLFTKWANSAYTVNGISYPGSDIIKYAKFFYTEETKAYLKPSQVNQPNWSSAVPIMMYMFKLQHNIKYEMWDKTDPYLKFLMSSKLDWLLDTDIIIPEYSIDELRDIQEQILTSPTVGLREQTTHLLAKRTDFLDFDKLPRLARFLIAQVWIYTPSVASSSEGMIRRLDNWDLPCTPIGGAFDIKAESSIKSTVLAPW